MPAPPHHANRRFVPLKNVRASRKNDGPAPSEAGQALPLLGLLLALTAAAALLLVQVGRVVDERTQASAAADAAALAGAAQGEAAAAALAEANGGVLESYREEGLEAVVAVRVGRARATARAARTPAAPPATWRPWAPAPPPSTGPHGELPDEGASIDG